jgi:hypothetical protein
MSRTGTAPDLSLRAVFAGRRGRLLAALLLAEFAAAVQGIAYATVLPLASRDLDGSRLYGATLAAGSLVSVLVLATSAGAHDRPAIGTAFGVASLIALGAWLATRLAPSRGSSRAREG